MKPALILVDIQNDYFPNGRLELSGIRAAGEKARQLLLLFREYHWPTFHVQHISIQKNAAFFIPNTTGVEFHDCIKPLQGEPMIQKHFPNSFRETGLRDELKKKHIKQIVICGAMSHMCVDATTRAAFDYGFNCVVIQDACATKDLEFGGETIQAAMVHGSFMAALKSVYARVLSVAEFKSEFKTGTN
ncbi:MAG: cysteine hydrolase [Deltaproteobacteria bacterium]|nr:cysteine hydrolase [Deltaproteobacteria bacterium]